MATRQRVEKAPPTRSRKRSKRKRSLAEVASDTNIRRREAYNNDPEHRERVKAQSRHSYRKGNPRQKVAPIRTVDAEVKEVTHVHTQELEYLVTLSVRELSEALGKSYHTIRRWIEDGILPPATYVHSTRSNPQYTVDEAKAIAEVLNVHAKDYDYLAVSHETTIASIWQKIEGIRKNHI